ncbi:MAG: ABC transporter permease [Ignavibacteriae bacterium]|nr:ABC transporter permease [Ignavibacteria bacterium]MBI3365525.1 ABC transporter permease [Ignavibacteriota bacterium]
MTKAFVVARWEYFEKIKSKAFLISLFLTPALMVAMSVLPALLASRADTESKVIGIIDQSGEVATPLSKILEERFKLPDGEPNYILQPIGQASDLSAGKRIADSLVLAESMEGYVVVGKSVMTDSIVEYRSENIGNIRVTENINSALRDLIVEKKLTAQGIDPKIVKDLTKPIDLKTIKLAKSGKEEESGFGQVFFTAYIFMMIMFVLILTSGQILVRSMLEEKSNRVVEILMSSCSARELMTGKILGLSGLGLTQMSFWVLMGLLLKLKLAIPMIPVGSLLLILLYIILGYVLYAAIFVAAGSPVSTEQEAQQITSYLVMILVIPIVFAFTVTQNPNTTLVKVLSFIPLLSPSMMIMRIPNQMPSVEEIVLTLILVALTAVAFMWVAGKVFRTTILMYGKRPSLKELLVLIRAA